MKRYVILIVAFAFLLSILVSCSNDKLPDGGAWYCEELEIEINFDAKNNGSKNYARKYVDDGTAYYMYYCVMENGSISISDLKDNLLIKGRYEYKSDVLYVYEDGSNAVYTFTEK